MKNKRQVKPGEICLFGFVRTNKQGDDTQAIMHQITPSANAKINSPTNKFISIFGSTTLLSSESNLVINPLFEFYILRLVVNDFISYDFKITTYKQGLVNDLIAFVTDQKETELITATATKLAVKVFEEMKLQVLSEIRKKGTRRQRISIAKKFIDQQAQIYIKQYLKIKHSHPCPRGEQILNTESYIRKQFEIAKQVEPLRPNEQDQKLRDFCESHKKFFNSQMKVDKRYNPTLYSIKINRPSFESEPVLVLLEDLLRLRMSNVNYQSESIVLARDILSELKRYSQETSETDKSTGKLKYASYYDLLSLQSIIFDQLSLRPKLSYEPLVRNALGLKNKPCSTECRLAFFCTPKEFDYYQSTKELEDDIKLILDDPHFGCKQMYRDLSKQQEKLVQKERDELQKIKEEICVDRYLLICYKMLSNKQFGKIQGLRLSYKAIKQHYSKNLYESKRAIKQNMERLDIFIDSKIHSKKIPEFNFTLDDLTNFMEEDVQDSTLEEMKDMKITMLFKLRYAIVNKIINIVKDDYFFAKLINAKKYAILFFVSGIQYLEELKAYVTIEPNRYSEIPKRKFKLERIGPRLPSGKGVSSSLNNTLMKIEEYHKRAMQGNTEKLDGNNASKNSNSTKDTKDTKDTKETNRYFGNHRLGMKLYQFIIEFSKKINKHRQDQESIIASLEKESNSGMDLSNKFQKIIKASISALDKDLTLYREIFFEFYYPEFELRYEETPQSLPKENSENPNVQVLEYRKQVSRRFGLILKAFLACKMDNYIIYDTILSKMLRLNQEEPKFKDSQQITEEAIKTERSILFNIDDLLEYTINAPKQYKYLMYEKDKQLISDAKRYNIKDDSLFVGNKFKNPKKYQQRKKKIEENKGLFLKEEDRDQQEQSDQEDEVPLPLYDKFFQPSKEW